MQVIDAETVVFLGSLGVCFAAGLVLGVGYFYALRRSVAVFLGEGRLQFGLGLLVGRAGFMAAGLGLADGTGGGALLAALTGVLVARTLMLRRVGVPE
jgi:hypothetical protein